MTTKNDGGPAFPVRGNHTPEPWALQDSKFSIIYSEHQDWRKNWAIDTRDTGRNYSDEQNRANARRIVACVNRLAGFTTEQIEDYGYDLAGVADWIAREQYLIEQQNRVLRQRDELFAALKIYEQAFEAMFAQCGSNGTKDAWGKTVNVSLLNEAHYHAEYAMRNSNK